MKISQINHFRMIIAIVKEPINERRVCLLPESIQFFTKKGVDVWVEKDAGIGAFASNESYEKMGAKIVNRKELLTESDLICSIQPLPTDDIDLLKPSAVYIGQLGALHDLSYTRHLISSKKTIFSLDLIPRTTRAQSMDVLSSGATVVGYQAVLKAAELLPRFFPMLMTAAGSIAPARVMVLGAGVAGLQAIATAKRLGATVYAFDVRQAAKEEVLSIGAKFIEVEGAVEDKNAGGYAVTQSEEYIKKQKEVIHEQATKADVIITTAQIPGKKAPLLIEEHTLYEMKPGAVIIDLAASSGGNCALSQPEKLVEVNQVRILGLSNLASSLPQDASKMFGKNLLNFIQLILLENNIKLNFEDDIVKETCVTHDGNLMNSRLLQLFNN
jgi:H+-translocating NAD(P) transhydrogenase subunit alpha